MVEQFLSLLAWIVGLVAAFHLLERLIPAERGQPIRSWLSNLAYVPVNIVSALLSSACFAPLFIFVIDLTGDGLLPAFGGPGSGVAAQILFALAYAFTWDLAQYAMHRLQHASPILWETHRFHHDERALNAGGAQRTHPTNYVLATLFHLPVVVLFGAQVPHFVATLLMFRVWGFVNHANLRAGLGPLAVVVASPQWHRIHHSALDEHRDRNFATFFPVIDWMFGTYHCPRPGEYPPTGVAGEPTLSPAAALLHPFRIWGGMIGRRFTQPAV